MLAFLDPTTLGFVIAVLLLTIAALMAFFLATSKTYAGFSSWTAAYALFAASVLLVILRAFIPEWISVLIGNYMLMLGTVLLYDGLTLFYGKRWRWYSNGALHVAAILCTAVLAYYLFVERDTNARIICFSVFRFIAALACLSAIVREKRSPTTELLGATYFLWAAMAVMRIQFAATASPIVNLLQQDTSLRTILLVDDILTLVSGFCLLVLIHSRLEDELKEARLDADRASRTDSLTGLWNRYHFEGEARREMERARRYGQTCSLLMFDIDHFKQVNDNFGHLAGDQVLKALATLAKDALRGSDLVCRWGGEEFVVIVPSGVEAALAAAEKLRQRVAEALFPAVGTVTISIGVAQLQSADDLASWTLRADEALYRAKAKGRNRVERETVVAVRKLPVTLHWNPSFSSGNPDIDAQHKSVFEKANMLLERCAAEDAAGAREIMNELMDEVERHFVYEESMLVGMDYPQFEEHQKAHDQLREHGHALQNALSGRTDVSAVLGEVAHFVVRELVLGHVAEEDMHYVEMMKDMRAA